MRKYFTATVPLCWHKVRLVRMVTLDMHKGELGSCFVEASRRLLEVESQASWHGAPKPRGYVRSGTTGGGRPAS